ncbi:hypothetical protein ACPZ19_29065 [Amycolatopsis lurida]
MFDERATRRVDVTYLPEDVVKLIDAIGPGEELLITRDGKPVATISSTSGRFGRTITEPGAPDNAAEPPSVTVVATAMKLSASARRSLSAELGSDYIVLDMHAAPTTAEVLLVPPASPQLIGGLRSMFPQARVIIAEVEDDVLGVSYPGPMRRMLDAGAETYLSSNTIPRLARQLDHTITQPPRTALDAPSRPGIEAPRERQLPR